MNGSLITSNQLIDSLDGRLSYRMFHYWCRTGRVQLAYDAEGSGTRRLITPAEAAAIHALVDEVEAINARQEAVCDGSFFLAALDRAIAGVQPA